MQSRSKEGCTANLCSLHIIPMDKCNELWVEQMKAEGKSNVAIASKLDVHPATIGRIVNREDIKARIDYCRDLIAKEAYAKSVQNVVQVINEYNDPTDDPDNKITLQRKQHGFTASMKVLESIGIVSGNSMAPTINNILNIQNSNIISPVVENLLKQSLASLSMDNVIDSEVDKDS